MIWGSIAYFKIISTPTYYNLDLMKVIIETDNDSVEFGDLFIYNFIKNKDLEIEGELSFEMIFTGEGGINESIIFL